MNQQRIEDFQTPWLPVKKMIFQRAQEMGLSEGAQVAINNALSSMVRTTIDVKNVRWMDPHHVEHAKQIVSDVFEVMEKALEVSRDEQSSR